MSKLIVLRGNSGSGKSSVARKIQDLVTPYPILIEHDIIRRKMLKEKDGPNNVNSELLLEIVQFGLKHDRDVILEGILRKDYYQMLFETLVSLPSAQIYFYYFDVSFGETLVRHQTKLNTDFGETEMRRWFKPDDQLGIDKEVIIPGSNSLGQTVAQIIKETNLSH